MNIAVVLIHNKGDVANNQQITSLLELLTVENGRYKFTNIFTPHEVAVFQIVPYGVARPSKINDVISHNVLYGNGDEDKVGDHPRFFNWGLKRSTDYGADIAIQVEDISKLENLFTKLTKVIDKQDATEFIDDPVGKIGSLKMLKEVGQLKEDRDTKEAIKELKKRIEEKGLMYG